MTLPPARPRPCPGCNERVPTVWVEAGGWHELRCGYCGLTLDRITTPEEAPPATEHPDEEPAYVAEARELSGDITAAGRRKPLLLVAEDSRFVRQMIVDHLTARFPHAELVSCGDGREALTAVTRALDRGERRGMLILDLKMPGLGGLPTAIAVRAVEAGLGRSPLPILFFSAYRADDHLKEAMQAARPAAYLNKGDAGDPERTLKRLDSVMGVLLRKVYERH